MIPYFSQPHLGPVHAFGVLVASGILLTIRLIRQRATRMGLDPVLAEKLSMRIVIVAFLCAHVFDRLAYYPAETLANPISLLKIWESISSFGGFIGAVIAAIWFVRDRRKQGDGWRYLDIVTFNFPIGWFFGRMGCFMAYDHPGSPTTFFLGQVYKDGVVRHNLGLEEALYVLPIIVLFQLLGRNEKRPTGFYLALFPLVYAPGRFILDFMRQEDARYFGLTPGHYGSVALVIVGIALMRWVHRPAKTA